MRNIVWIFDRHRKKATTWSIFRFLLIEDNLFQQLIKEDFRMPHVMTTGAYDLLVVTTWKILTTGASFLTTGTLSVEELGYKGYPLRTH